MAEAFFGREEVVGRLGPAERRGIVGFDILLDGSFGSGGGAVSAALDPVDENSRLAPMLVERVVTDPPQGGPLRAGLPGLDDIEIAPGSVDPDAEAGHVAVPDNSVIAFGLQLLHNPSVRLAGTSLGHFSFPTPKPAIKS